MAPLNSETPMKINNIFSYFLSMVLLCAFCTCKPNRDIQAIDLNTRIKSLSVKLLNDSTKDKIEVNFCQLVPLAWDTILVVGPYQSILKFDALKLNNEEVFKRYYEVADDSKTTLFYVKNRVIIGYSYYNNAPPIFNVPVKVKNDIWIITRNLCSSIYLIKNQQNRLQIKLIR